MADDINVKAGKFDIYIHTDNKYGYFEHDIYGDEYSGGLWFNKKELVDFDGVYALPEEIANKLIELGFKVDKNSCCGILDTYIIECKLGKKYEKQFCSRTECKQWIENNLDLSLGWSFYKQTEGN